MIIDTPAPVQYSDQYDEIYQLAADMGGAGYVFTGEHDVDIMTNSAAININLIKAVNSLNDLKGLNGFIMHVKCRILRSILKSFIVVLHVCTLNTIN
jgi:hypothetical protein